MKWKKDNKDKIIKKRENKKKKQHRAFMIAPNTGNFVNNWYEQNRQAIFKEKNELIQSASQRLDTNARKLSLLYAILENDAGDNLIRLEQFKAALEVAEYWKKSMVSVFGLFAKDDQSKYEQLILNRLRKNPRTKRQLMQNLSRQMNAEKFNRAVDALIKADRVGLQEKTLTLK